ncbi:MAG: ribose-phosphate diphosphokinase, partial [Clostridia bacterium]|nr:ribose-phosphate diphosphokinase [Clostridia bacterium]
FRQKAKGDYVVVSPDPGGVPRARDLADRLGVPLAIIDKRRPEPNVSEVMNIIGKVSGRHVIMVDDMIDTAGTIAAGAEALMAQGALSVSAGCTHPVLSGPAYERLNAAPIDEVVVTNTIPLDPAHRGGKFRVLSIGPLLAEAIIRIHEDLSVSALFT